MYGPYSRKYERFSWNDLKHQGVVNLDGRPSVGLYSYVSTLSLPPGSTPTVARDPLSGVQVLAHLTSVPSPEPFFHKLSSKRLEGFEVSAIVYDFMQYSLYYTNLRRQRSDEYMRKYFPNNPCTHYKPKFIRRLPKELLHFQAAANNQDSTENQDKTCLSHDELMQHLEKLEKQELDLNEHAEVSTNTPAGLKKCVKRDRGARELEEETECEDEDDEFTEEEEPNAYNNDTKKASTNNKHVTDSSDDSNDEEDTDKDSEMGTMDDDDYYGLYSGNESRDGYRSEDDGAFYE